MVILPIRIFAIYFPKNMPVYFSLPSLILVQAHIDDSYARLVRSVWSPFQQVHHVSCSEWWGPRSSYGAIFVELPSSDPPVEKWPHLLHWGLIFYESIGAQLAIGAFRPSGPLAHTPYPCVTRLYLLESFLTLTTQFIWTGFLGVFFCKFDPCQIQGDYLQNLFSVHLIMWTFPVWEYFLFYSKSMEGCIRFWSIYYNVFTCQKVYNVLVWPGVTFNFQARAS